MDSIITQNTNHDCPNNENTEIKCNELWTCNICHKTLQTERGLKIYRIHCLKKQGSAKILSTDPTINNLTLNVPNNVNINNE